MNDDPAELEEVRRRLGEIQRQKRARIRWKIGKHTAEMVIGALDGSAKPPRRSGKQRRRKRWKRLL